MKLVDDLNKIFGERLGLNRYGEPVFKWEWTEDLFWPAYKTDKTVEEKLDSGLWI